MSFNEMVEKVCDFAEEHPNLTLAIVGVGTVVIGYKVNERMTVNVIKKAILESAEVLKQR